MRGISKVLLCFLAICYVDAINENVQYILSKQENNVKASEYSVNNVLHEKSSPNLASEFQRKRKIAELNLGVVNKERVGDAPIITLKPGDEAATFTLNTLSGDVVYPGPIINRSIPVLLHVFNSQSGFASCLWNCSGSLEALVQKSPPNTHYIFFSTSEAAYDDALWMKQRFKTVLDKLVFEESLPFANADDFLSRLHFATLPVWQLGNWIPQLFQQWSCLDHNCGLDQIKIQSEHITGILHHPLVLPRLDARYDWLPSPSSTFNNKTLSAVYTDDGCAPNKTLANVLAIVSDKGCSYFKKVQAMQESGALGVVVLSSNGVQDMNCEGTECNTPLKIPATSVQWNQLIVGSDFLKVSFQSVSSDNFFAAIDNRGRLAECGWFLYPSMSFLAWQAQW